MKPAPVNLKGMADRLLSMVIERQVKKLAKKEGNLTVERVMQDMDEENLNTILRYGYTMDEIRGLVEDAINKNQKHS